MFEISEFFNNVSSYFFAPYIPERIGLAKNSKTLVDNIFVNTIEFISGNLTFQIPIHPSFLVCDI